MKRMICLFVWLFVIGLPAYAADEKIDPATYICAEFVTSPLDGTPPIFEALQLDGYAAAKSGNLVAAPESIQPMILAVMDSCSPKPTDKTLEHWQQIRKNIPYAKAGQWVANVTKCADYNLNPDDGSGFVIWLDGYNRGKSGINASIFENQQTLDSFLQICKDNPDKLMLDVLKESAK